MGPNVAEKLDPVELAFENAPEIGPDDMSAEELARLEDVVREARLELEAGAELVPHNEVMRRARAHFGVE